MKRDLQIVLDAIPDGVLVLDGAARVERVNGEACRILETSADHAEGRDLAELLGAGHPIAERATKALESGRTTTVDGVSIERRDGDLEVDASVRPLRAVERGESGAVLVLRDRTLRDRLHEIVTAREQLVSYGHIAAGIAHEVKNPLGGIRGAGELLAGWAEDDRSRETAQRIVHEVDRISALVEELMVFARGERLAERLLNLHFVLDGVLDLLQLDPLGEKVEVERFYDPSIPELVADPDRLTQVFLNLCRNALQAMEEGGGVLTISTRMSLDHRLSDAEGRRVPTVVVSVSDTGPGIARDVLDKMTTPFFTTRAKGTGLGLAVSRHWVSRHDGSLRITSQPGQGTTVHVALPLRRGDAAPDHDEGENP